MKEESALGQRQALASPFWLMVLVWAVAVLLAFFGVRELKAPKPAGATAAAGEFSAERAMLHVNQIARSPHPLGSANAAAVREYLLAQLSALGMNPQVFPAIGIHKSSRTIVVGDTRDIVGKLPGTSNSRAVLLMAHYDSVDSAPGAADDGAGVSAILEAVRALRAGPVALKNDLIVLFTEGEETGLLGAEAFISAHPLAKDVGIVLNFEARGDSGPSILFETSNNNRPLIEMFAKADAHPIASSLFYSLYKLLPNDTDFTVFRPSGVPGLNFAFGENLQSYHSTLDTPGNLSLASLQHHGEHALALARKFGQADLNHLPKGGDEVFFNWFGSGLVYYGQRWVVPGELAATALLVLLVLWGVRQENLRLSRITLSLLPCLALLVAVPAVMSLVRWLLGRVLAGRMLLTDSPANACLLAGLVLAGTCAGMLLWKTFRRRFHSQELAFSGLILLDVISWALALLLPAGSYLVFWPLLAALVVLLVVHFAGKGPAASRQWLAGFTGLIISVLLFAPVAYLLYIFLTFQWPTVAAVGLLISLGLLASAFCLDVMMPRRGWYPLLLVLLAASAGMIGAGVLKSHHSVEYPQADSLIYSLNEDDHTASWISYDQLPDSWTAQFIGKKAQRQPLPKYLAGSSTPVLAATAPTLDLAPPVIEITEHTNKNGLQRLHLRVRSQRNAKRLYLAFDNDVQPVSIKVAGRSIQSDPASRRLSVNLVGMPAEGVDMELELKTDAHISFWLMDQSSGLPEIHIRPKEFVARQGSDTTIVCRKYTI
jgi:hypothetical protein